MKLSNAQFSYHLVFSPPVSEKVGNFQNKLGESTFIAKIIIPTNVKVFCFPNKRNVLVFAGHLGTNILDLGIIKKVGRIKFKKLNNKKTFSEIVILVEVKNRDSLIKSKRSLITFLKLIEQKVIGVCQGFLQTLNLIGVGYRVSLNDAVKKTQPGVNFKELNLLTSKQYDITRESLLFKLGYSNPISLHLPKGVLAFCPKNSQVQLFCINLQTVSQAIAEIKSLRKLDSYKGKGISYLDDNILLKIGKRK